LRRLNVDLVCDEGNSDGFDSTLLPLPAGRRDDNNGNMFAGIDSTLENRLLRTEWKDVPCWCDILIAVAANLGEVYVGWDDTWVLVDGVCNILIAVAALLGEVRAGWDDTWVLIDGV
jgi:hypothetical protein